MKSHALRGELAKVDDKLFIKNFRVAKLFQKGELAKVDAKLFIKNFRVAKLESGKKLKKADKVTKTSVITVIVVYIGFAPFDIVLVL